MNPERLLQNFDRLIDTPDAVPRLRRFILDLAVRGKLVEQNPGDEPAGELWKRIEGEKAHLIKSGKIRSQQPIPPIDEQNTTFDIPVTWTWVRLGTIGDWGSGSTPPRGNSEYYGGAITWLKSGELEDKINLRGSDENVTEVALKKCSFRLNKVGDILIAMYGATIGKLAILGETAVTNQAVCGCTPFAGIFNRYLFMFLLSQREYFLSQSEGGAQPNISKVKIINFGFPLPPLAEQYRIVAKVDELMKLCDELEATQAKRERRRDRLVTSTLHSINNDDSDSEASERLPLEDSARFYFNHLPRLTTRPEHIQQLLQTILNLAVRGGLVPQNSEDEPAGELLKRIEEGKKRLVKIGTMKERKPLSPIEDSAIPFDVPESWKWTRLGDSVNNHFGGGTPSKSISNYWNGDIFWASVKDIGKTKYVDKTIDMITQEGLENSSSNLIPPGNLIVVTRMGLGKLSINRVPIAINQDLRALILSSLASIDFYYIFFKTASYEGSGLTVKGIKVEELLNFPFPLPPLAEQHRIVAKVDELMALCNEMETRITTNTTTSRKLFEATLQEALCGTV
jgi:type I restriction enzyme S subunit